MLPRMSSTSVGASAPAITTVRAIPPNPQTSPDIPLLPLVPSTSLAAKSYSAPLDNARVLQPSSSASSSSARAKSPLRQSSVASPGGDSPPPGAFRGSSEPVSSSNGRIGSPLSTAAATPNSYAPTSSPRGRALHNRLPGSAGGVYGYAIQSSPAPMSFAGSPGPPLAPRIQPSSMSAYSPGPPAPPLPSSQPPPFARPNIPRSQSNNVYPTNQSSQSLATPGMSPGFSAMRPQSSPIYYPANIGSPRNRSNLSSSSPSQRLRPGTAPSNIPAVPAIPDPSSQRPTSYASLTPMNSESYPPGISSNYPQSMHQRTPSRRPTEDAYVANDPFRPHSQKNAGSVDNNLTFDDIPMPASTPDPSQTARRYMTLSSSRPATVTAPPGPTPLYSSQTPAPTEYVPPVPIASEYTNNYSSATPVYRPATSSGQSASSPQPVAPVYAATPPMRTPYSQVSSSWSEYPPTYVSVDTPGLGINLNQGSSNINTPGSPVGTPDPARPTVVEVGEHQANGVGPATSTDQIPQPSAWNPNIPLVPVRRPTDESWFDPYPYDFHPADTTNIYTAPYLPFPDNNAYMGYMDPVSDDTGFWSRVSGMFRALLPKKSTFEYAAAMPAIELESQRARYRTVAAFVGKTLPRQVYLHLLLRLPSLYFSRVARIFEEADLTLPEIKKMALETASQGSPDTFDALSFEAGIAAVPPQYERLKVTWESFIDSVMREWKTFNIISVLLLSCVSFCSALLSLTDDSIYHTVPF